MQHAFDTLFGDGRKISLDDGAPVFHAEDPCSEMFVVVSGQVALLRHGLNGSRMRLYLAGPGDVVAEASAYSETYHCDGFALGATSLIAIPRAKFLERLDADPALARCWTARLAHSLQKARLLAQIRTLRTVGERLDMWLTEGGSLPPRGHWQDLAEVIGVSREALYREIARRRSGRPGPETEKAAPKGGHPESCR